MPTNKNDPHRYDDMLFLPHHVSHNHPPMTVLNRAAQFAPFAALTGYDAAISETARQTSEKIELDENSREILDEKLQLILEHMQKVAREAPISDGCAQLRNISKDYPEVEITYFRPDEKKDGGKYLTVTAQIKKLDSYDNTIVTLDGSRIAIDDVIDLQSNLFAVMDME